jgi:hypothetical protein
MVGVYKLPKDVCLIVLLTIALVLNTDLFQYEIEAWHRFAYGTHHRLFYITDCIAGINTVGAFICIRMHYHLNNADKQHG